MPISQNDLVFRLSQPTANSGFWFDQTDPNLSLGYYMASAIMATGLNGLFDDVTGAENAAQNQEYRCVFIHNINTSGTLTSGIIFISGEVAGGANLYLGVDPFPASTGRATTQQAVSGVNEDTSPTGVDFYNPLTYATGLAIGNIAPLFCKAIWCRRDPLNGPAVNSDGSYIVIQGDSTQ